MVRAVNSITFNGINSLRFTYTNAFARSQRHNAKIEHLWIFAPTHIETFVGTHTLITARILRTRFCTMENVAIFLFIHLSFTVTNTHTQT